MSNVPQRRRLESNIPLPLSSETAILHHGEYRRLWDIKSVEWDDRVIYRSSTGARNPQTRYFQYLMPESLQNADTRRKANHPKWTGHDAYVSVVSRTSFHAADHPNTGLTMPQFKMSDEETFKVFKAALSTVNVWNGSDHYGTPDANSLHLMNRYFTKYPEDTRKVVLSIKTGLKDRMTMEMDCSPEGIRKVAENALEILDGKKTIDLLGPSRVDPNVPVEDSLKALAELKQEGKIGGIQLSEVRADTIRRAAKIVKIDMLEAEASLWSPMIFENGVAETCAELDIVVEAHTPLGQGMLAGNIKRLDDLPKDRIYHLLPRFQPDTFPLNLKLVEAVEKLAVEKECTSSQLALSWLKNKSKKPGMPVIVPIPGARSESRVLENAQGVGLTDNNLQEIDSIMKAFPPAGLRTLPRAALYNEY